MLKEELIEWLLAGAPWAVYRTLTDLLEKGEEDNVVVTAKMAIPQRGAGYISDAGRTTVPRL